MLARAVNGPLEFICRATIPCCDEKHWSRKRASVNPFFGMLTILIASERKSSPFSLIVIDFNIHSSSQQTALVCSAIVGILIHFTTL